MVDDTGDVAVLINSLTEYLVHQNQPGSKKQKIRDAIDMMMDRGSIDSVVVTSNANKIMTK